MRMMSGMIAKPWFFWGEAGDIFFSQSSGESRCRLFVVVVFHKQLVKTEYKILQWMYRFLWGLGSFLRFSSSRKMPLICKVYRINIVRLISVSFMELLLLKIFVLESHDLYGLEVIIKHE